MKNKFVLILLFILPIVVYLIFASAKHNSLFLPVISENHQEIPSSWKSLSGEKVILKDKITVLGFTGSNIDLFKSRFFNLNQKIYNKYFGFKDFQMVMVAPLGAEDKIQRQIDELKRITTDMKGWNFVFASPDEISSYFDTFRLISQLEADLNFDSVIILDKNRNLRGRKGKNKKGEDEFKDSYNSVSAAELHNEMSDDVKIILREYRLALKKNTKRKDNFRDKIIDKVDENRNK